MALTPNSVGATFPQREFSYDSSRTILYALGVGAGADGDIADLRFVFENDLQALPSLATVIAWDDSWIPALGLNETMIVHGEQRVTLHSPLPPAAAIRARSRLAEVIDKGQEKGAILYVETIIEKADGSGALATLLSTVFARGDGGFGGPASGGQKPHRLPERQPDLVFDTAIALNQALIYRLSGDRNRLHIDPKFAVSAGFAKPILHGLSTYGVAVRSIVKAALANDPSGVAHIAARFSAPVFPGEAVRTQIWRDEDTLSFRMIVPADERVVLDNGLLTLRQDPLVFFGG